MRMTTNIGTFILLAVSLVPVVADDCSALLKTDCLDCCNRQWTANLNLDSDILDECDGAASNNEGTCLQQADYFYGFCQICCFFVFDFDASDQCGCDETYSEDQQTCQDSYNSDVQACSAQYNEYVSQDNDTHTACDNSCPI
jgi:hypothetical protein